MIRRAEFESRRGPAPWACIDTDAITHNFQWLKQRLNDPALASPPRFWAVVKADAYGHGMQHALCALADADGLCVASLDDVLLLRQQGWTKPILLLSVWGLACVDLQDPLLGELHVVIDDWAQLNMLERIGPTMTPARGRPHLHAWLRAAGHLRSLGFGASDYAAAYGRLCALVEAGTLVAAGHLHHYAASEDAEALNLERLAFLSTTEGLPGPFCTGNSGALCGAGPGPLQSAGHWLRCGLLLYGASALPSVTGPQLGLRPAMSLHARLLAVRSIKAGETVGYGDSYRAERNTCIGTVGIGYGHGVPRRLWQRGQILAGHRGRTVPLAGRVAMDCLTVDLGPQPQERAGDIMTLWGRAPGGALQPVEDTADACDTIAAELLTALTGRVERIATRNIPFQPDRTED